MDDDEAWAFLEAAHTSILTTLRRDGWPVSLPVWHVVDNRRIYVSTPPMTKKVARVRNDDRACLLVERGEAWVDLAAVEFAARATVLDPGEEADRVARMLDEKYASFRPSRARQPDAMKKHYAAQAVIRLDPAGKLLTWDNTRMRLDR